MINRWNQEQINFHYFFLLDVYNSRIEIDSTKWICNIIIFNSLSLIIHYLVMWKNCAAALLIRWYLINIVSIMIRWRCKWVAWLVFISTRNDVTDTAINHIMQQNSRKTTIYQTIHLTSNCASFSANAINLIALETNEKII